MTETGRLGAIFRMTVTHCAAAISEAEMLEIVREFWRRPHAEPEVSLDVPLYHALLFWPQTEIGPFLHVEGETATVNVMVFGCPSSTK